MLQEIFVKSAKIISNKSIPFAFKSRPKPTNQPTKQRNKKKKNKKKIKWMHDQDDESSCERSGLN